MKMDKKDFEKVCELLPEGYTWGCSLTPDIALHIVNAALSAVPANHSEDQRADFEAWAKTHGGLDLTTHEAMDNEQLSFPCTYYSYTTEIAWRAYANKKVLAIPANHIGDSNEMVSCSDFMQSVTKVTSLEYDLDGLSSNVQHRVVSAAQKYDEYMAQQPAQKPLSFVRERAQLEQEWAELQHLKKAYAQEPVKQESWISVGERLPAGDRFVDVFVKSRSNLDYGTRFTEFRFINGQFDVSSIPSACYVSHWMYQPLPPIKEVTE
jgi:hypothetical protein